MLASHMTLDERGQRLLDIAARLILRYGYDKTTMQNIALEAAVSTGTLYHYWRSKEKLFQALITRETLRVFDEWLERVQADPAGGTLFGIYRHGFLTLLAHPLMMAFYTKESFVLGDYVRQRGPAVYTRPYLLNRALVQQLQAVGLIRQDLRDRKSTRLNSSHDQISYAVFCLKKKNTLNPRRLPLISERAKTHAA